MFGLTVFLMPSPLVLPEYSQQWYMLNEEPRVKIADLDRPGDSAACKAWWQPILRLRG